MAELLLIRHAQASFEAEDYDRLSDLGHRQAEMAGQALRDAGWVPDRLVTGTLHRQGQTLAAMGFDEPAETHAGLDEYDFRHLIALRHANQVPDAVRIDRKAHFRALRDAILEWQGGGLGQAGETWAEFVARVEAARIFATDTTARRVLVVTSGGPIGQMVAASLDAPPARMITLNLQVKNTSMTRFFFSKTAFFLNEFNSTPHFAPSERAAFLTYS